MKILKLTAENIKKLVAVEITPDGNLVQITGKNAQGKTSVLDSIAWAIEGKEGIQFKPIRDGETQAFIKLDLGEIVVTRKFKKKENGEITTHLIVENQDGAAFGSPQKMLDDFLGSLSFDPLAFARMDAKKQFETLRQFVTDIDFESIDAANKNDYDERTRVNKDSKEARTLSDGIAIRVDTPNEEINDKELLDELGKAGEHNGSIEVRKSNRANLGQKAIEKEALAKQKEGEAIDARKRAQEFEEEAKALRAEAAEINGKLASAGPLPTPIDVAVLQQKIEEAKILNENVRKKKQKVELAAKAKALEAKSEELTRAIDNRNNDKARKIAAAKLPIEGLGFSEGFITMNGVPFNQASDAQQLSASIAIAMALNPKLRVIRVRDGSLLDDDSMKLLAKLADEKDYQIWIERVDGSGKVGFVLEDGHLKDDNRKDGSI